MKKITKQIKTTEVCSYGCGNVANYINGSQRLMCCKTHNNCPANKERNSLGVKRAHKLGLIPTDFGGNFDRGSRKNKFSADFSLGGKGRHKEALIYERGHSCECCKLSTWLDKQIVLELDHIDGNNKNNLKDNLRLLCPNCHSMTPTWRRGKRKNEFNTQKFSDDIIIDAIKSSENLNQVLSKLDLRYGSASTIVKIMGKYRVDFMGS